MATIIAIDLEKQRIDIEHKSGGRYQLDLTQREHQHFNYGYAVTAQRAQGADAFPIINAPSWRVNTVHLTFAYIAASRTSGSVFMVTDGLDKLTEALEARSGQQIAALDQEKSNAGLAEAKVREMAVERVAARQIAMAFQRDGNGEAALSGPRRTGVGAIGCVDCGRLNFPFGSTDAA